jgi:CDP-diacylglycerol--glycerol-3-phosphate 3-phosphatidyltransferase
MSMNWSWLPNSLTVLRFFAGIALLWIPAPWQFWVLLVAGFTDLIDGWLSRQLGGTSHFGRIVDPIADKTLVVAALVCVLRNGWLTPVELVLVAARDIAVTALSVVALFLKGANWKKLQPRLSGKIATGGQVVALLMLFATQQRRPVWVMIAAVLSVWSAIDYTLSAYRTWSQDRDPQL